MRNRGADKCSHTVREDWLAWIPNEMDDLFDATRKELESSDVILSITLDEALALCKGGQFESAREPSIVFVGLFDRLADRLCQVIHAIKEHASQFGTLPAVQPLAPANFRGEISQRAAFMNNLLARVLFRERTRFLHKLHSLDEIVAGLQKQAAATVQEMIGGDWWVTEQSWRDLEILGYDLNSCMSETIITLKSFFCVLPGDELDAFRRKLTGPNLAQGPIEAGRPQSFHRE